MKKKIAVAAAIACALLALWCGMVIADYTRCAALREPLFARVHGVTADDGGSGTYKGLGYTVTIEKYIGEDGVPAVEEIEMRLFGRLIFAAIT